MHSLNEFRQFAEDLADTSRSIIRAAAHRPVDPEVKPDNSPVTSTDKAVEDALRAAISKRFPEHGVIGEERADTAPDAEFKWIIDPIDGTLPFLAGLPTFGTLIALVHGDAPIIGVIDMSMTAERWIGCKGAPTTRNGAHVRARACASLSSALMSTSNPNYYTGKDRPALARLNAATRWCVYGGSCMAYAQIASGRIDVGIEVTYNIHDYMALVPVIQGAGGVITDWNGAELTIRSGERFIAAGERRILDQALAVLSGG